MPIVEPFLDPNQCGGLSKTSTNHYLIKLMDFIHTTLDMRTPHAAVLAALDLSKAYNRGDSLVIEDLHAMHAPGFVVAILCSYLNQRSLSLKYQGSYYKSKDLPGGFGAGTWMGGILFIVKFNGACMRPPIPRPITEGAHTVLRGSVRAPEGFSEDKPEAAKPRGHSLTLYLGAV